MVRSQSRQGGVKSVTTLSTNRLDPETERIDILRQLTTEYPQSPSSWFDGTWASAKCHVTVRVVTHHNIAPRNHGETLSHLKPLGSRGGFASTVLSTSSNSSTAHTLITLGLPEFRCHYLLLTARCRTEHDQHCYINTGD